MVYSLAQPSSLPGSPVLTGALPPRDIAYGAQCEYGYRTNVGMGTVSERLGWGSVALTGQSGIVFFNFFRAPRSQPVTRWDMACAAAAAATPTLVRGGLYSVDASYNLTQLAASPNDTTLFNTANAKTGKAFSTAYPATFGTWYAFAFLLTSATTMPTVLGMPSAGGVTHFAQDTDPRTTAVMIGAQTDLPATVTPGQLNATNLCLWAELS